MKKLFNKVLFYLFIFVILIFLIYRKKIKNWWKKKKFKKAIRKYHDIIAEHFGQEEELGARFMVAKIYQENLLDFKNAIKEYEKILEDFSEGLLLDEALFNMGKCYLRLDDKISAKKTFKKLIEEYHNSPLVEEAKHYLLKL